MTKKQDTRSDDSSYDAQYPMNQVFETPAGHQFQVDNTPGAERVFFRHSAGTLYEFSSDGKVQQINVGDVKVYNKAGVSTTTDENSDTKVTGHSRTIVGGGVHAEVAGDSGIMVGGDMAIAGMGKMNMRAQSIYMGSDGTLNINVKGAINIVAGGDIKINGATIRLNG